MRFFYSSLSLALAVQFAPALAAAAEQGPQIEKGEIITNARIVCGNQGSGDFHTAPDTTPHALPYNGGPTGTEDSSGQWTGCHAVTVAEYRANPPVENQWSGTLMIAQDLGGRCNPSGTGGAGWGQPTWRSTLKLPDAGPNKTWHVAGTFNAVQDDAAPSAPSPCQLSIHSAREMSHDLSRPSTDQKFSFDSLEPGTHRIELTCPGEISGGCLGDTKTETNDRQPQITVNFVMEAK